jgi:hypothetical protein
MSQTLYETKNNEKKLLELKKKKMKNKSPKY